MSQELYPKRPEAIFVRDSQWHGFFHLHRHNPGHRYYTFTRQLHGLRLYSHSWYCLFYYSYEQIPHTQ